MTNDKQIITKQQVEVILDSMVKANLLKILWSKELNSFVWMIDIK